LRFYTAEGEGAGDSVELAARCPGGIDDERQGFVIQWAAQHYRVGPIPLDRLAEPAEPTLFSPPAELLGVEDAAERELPGIGQRGVFEGPLGKLRPPYQQCASRTGTDRPEPADGTVDEMTLDDEGHPDQSRQQDESG
jgi:hypothetical protein